MDEELLARQTPQALEAEQSVLGSMLIGFTVFQLQRLSQMEFKTVGK